MYDFSSYSSNKQLLLQAIRPLTGRERIARAVKLAEQYHAGQKRDEIEPEGRRLCHPLRPHGFMAGAEQMHRGQRAYCRPAT